MTTGPCAKAVVVCEIRTPAGWKVTGRNDCANPQPVCPRQPGEDYTKCKTVCQQMGHAEEQAIETARIEGLDLLGSTATVKGHTYFCISCQHALFKAGVRWLTVAR
jgi:deoxycytidylate deaminase